MMISISLSGRSVGTSDSSSESWSEWYVPGIGGVGGGGGTCWDSNSSWSWWRAFTSESSSVYKVLTGALALSSGLDVVVSDALSGMVRVVSDISSSTAASLGS